MSQISKINYSLENIQKTQQSLLDNGINIFTIQYGVKFENKNIKPFFTAEKRNTKVSTHLQNTCVVVGKPSNRLCVIDFDEESLKNLEILKTKSNIFQETYIVKTGKGFHLYIFFITKF